MKKKQIVIDQEIFDFLKSQAEPFIDTPNDVLRRLLLNKHVISKSRQDISPKSSTNTPPPISAGTPKALEQILQVIYLVCFQGISRPQATKMIAELNDVKPQTVLDKYCRQLNLTTSEFDKLLSETNIITLKNKLHDKFIDHCEVIDNYLN